MPSPIQRGTLGRVGGGATATLALGADNTLASLSSDASNTTSVELNGYVLTLDPTSSTASDFGGAIVDGSAAGSLVIDGTGDVELTGANTFSGGTTLIPARWNSGRIIRRDRARSPSLRLRRSCSSMQH